MRRIVLAAAFVLTTAFVPGATAAQPESRPVQAASASTAGSTALGILGSLGAILTAIRATKLAERGLEKIQSPR